jgi:nicotinate-nucleotide--dimethylbenzimidazole phosphoribosyltransferase
VGAELVVVDVGVAGRRFEPGVDGSDARLLDRRVASGTRDFSVEPAMSAAEVGAAIAAGRDVIADLAGGGVDLVAVGEMGIGNTTSASAVVAALTGRDPREVTGRGTGVDDAGWNRKVDAVARGLAVNRPGPGDPLATLSAVGGLEIAALVGLIVGASARRLPLVLDGFITGAAALVATALHPDIAPRLLAGHRSVEPGHAIVLERLGLRPLLDLDMRLGEGTGAALAMGLVTAAAAVRDGMATFEEAAVSDRL